MRWRGLIQWLSFWGAWPALLMVLCQWEVARFLQVPLTPDVWWLTFAGTLAIYGLDRGVERHIQASLAPHHMAPAHFHRLMAIIVAGVLILGLVQIQWAHLPWFMVLGLSGAAYLWVTWGQWAAFPLLKEILGAWCFTFLVWGSFTYQFSGSLTAFFCMGLANFLLSSVQDTPRDTVNQVTSFALVFPRLALWLGRLLALVSAGLFFYFMGPGPFALCALTHAFFPVKSKRSVDWAFLPILTMWFFYH